jgi:hypothetical protein
MQIIFISLLTSILCSLTAMSFADEKSDCLNKCNYESSSSKMYCPPAGGYSDEDHKQCSEKNNAAYNDCIKGCSPPVAQPETQPVTNEPPVTTLPEVRDPQDKLQ